MRMSADERNQLIPSLASPKVETVEQESATTAGWSVWLEFGLLLIVAVAGALAALLGAPVLIRVLFGVPLVLFIPGYALVSALFPSNESIDGLERLALGFGLSLAVMPLVALGIQYSPWRLGLRPIVGGLLATTVVFTAVAIFRRRRVPAPQRFAVVIPGSPIPPVKTWDRTSWIAAVLIAVSLLLLLGSGAVLVYQRLQGNPITEFALYNADGKPEFYPRDLVPGQGATVLLAVTNREKASATYHIVVRADNTQVAAVPDFTVARGAEWRGPVQIRVPVLGEQIPIVFELYRDSDETSHQPYRTLRLFVNGVRPTPTNP